MVIRSSYGAGAAHPNYGFETFNFTCTDELRQFSLDELFNDPYAAEQEISKLCIERISHEYWRRTGQTPDERDAVWIAEGCKPHEDNFREFSVTADGLSITFAPYDIGSYAEGIWTVEISYYDLLPLLRQPGPYGLIKR